MDNEIIKTKPIGIIHTPFATEKETVPIQGRLCPETIGRVELYQEYTDGILGLEGFSHILLIYYFHRSRKLLLSARPYLGEEEQGIFAIRSPHRPNHIGITLVELIGIENNILTVKGVDMFNATPLLDIKPYNPVFDHADKVRTGWMEKAISGREGPGFGMITGKKKWLHLD